MPMAGGGYMSTASNKIEFFVEKDGDISEVKFRSGVLPAIRKKRIDSLSSLMDDCPEIVQKLNDENFEFGHDNIINLIRSYNVCMFKSEPWPLQKTSTVMMYSRVRQGNVQRISISVNDSTLAYIPVNGTVAINISSTHPNKVCVASGDLKTCDIILSSQYFVKQFEVMLNNKKRKLEIEQKTFEEAQKYIMEVRKSRVGGN
jgi:hypothetical protein